MGELREDRSACDHDRITAYPYPDDARAEMLVYVPRGLRRVLDVGCGHGGFGAELKHRDPVTEVWGLDSSELACAEASGRLDRVLHGRFPEALEESGASFDCIVFNDVLEHLLEPWEALRRTVPHLEPSAIVVASVPNVRDLRVLGPLVLRGKWKYADLGLLDRTHLRFFTRSSVRSLFVESGYEIDALDPINLGLERRFPRASRVLEVLLGAGLNDLRTPQYAVVAHQMTAQLGPTGPTFGGLRW